MTNNHLMSVFNGRRSNAIHAIASPKMEKWFSFRLTTKGLVFLGNLLIFKWRYSCGPHYYIHNSRHLYLFESLKNEHSCSAPSKSSCINFHIFSFFFSQQKKRFSFVVEITGRSRTGVS